MPKRTSLTKAQLLDKGQFDRVVGHIRRNSLNKLRDEVILRLSFYCGLRAAEIAGLQWAKNLLDADGAVLPVLRVTRDITKGRVNRTVEREIPIEPQLHKLLTKLRAARPEDVYLAYPLAPPRVNSRAPEGSVDPNTLVQWFRRLYAEIGFQGCTSHSGRRTFITSLSRKANLHGSSIVDVQRLAGHKRLQTTADYVEPSPYQRSLVSAVF